MKKALKIIGVLIGLVVLVVAGFLAFVAIRGVPKYEPKVPNIANVDVTPERVAEGKRIATMLCRDCHYNPDTKKFTGREMSEVSEFGIIRSRNITQDKEAGIGKWSDADIIYFIRTGIHPTTGQYVPPFMPKLMRLSDEDMACVVSFLHSSEPEVQPDKTELPPSEHSFLTKFLSTVAFKPYPFPEQPIARPDTTNPVAWGKYLALDVLDCWTCHSGDFTKMDVVHPENSFRFLGGGNKMKNEHGDFIFTANITPDEATGIGSWTEEQFVRAVKYGLVDGRPALRSPMKPFSQLSDNEAKALFAYLRTVPPINNKVERNFETTASVN